MKHKIVALIPARSKSERLKNKNILKVGKYPLLAIPILTAKKSKIFDKIIVSTDSKKYARIAKKYGAEVPFLRPKKISSSVSPDYDWVNYTIKNLSKKNINFDIFFILRPTNPFRSHKTILSAWKKFKKYKKAESLRAIEVSKQHPGKMWIRKSNYIIPFFSKSKKGQPYYNQQLKSLPKIYKQNASLEISKVKVLNQYKTITGKKILPFFTKNYEGFDINEVYDIKYANSLLKNKKVKI